MAAHKDVGEILGSYKSEYWGEPFPVLDEAQQTAVKEHFDANGMVMIAGVSLINGEVDEKVDGKLRTIRSVVDSDMKHIMHRVPESIPGPYFVSGQYRPEALGIWAVSPVVEAVAV